MSNHHQRSGAAVAYFQSSSIFQSSMSSAGGIIEAAVSYSTTQRNKTGIKKLKEYIGVKGLQVDLSVNSDGTDITFNLMNEYAKYLVQYKKSDGEYLSHGSLGNYLDGLRAYIQSLKNISDSHWIHNRDRYKRILRRQHWRHACGAPIKQERRPNSRTPVSPKMTWRFLLSTHTL